MAKFELKFIDCANSNENILCNVFDTGDQHHKKVVEISGHNQELGEFSIWLDKSTAIKFSKTLRTEINKITESEATDV